MTLTLELKPELEAQLQEAAGNSGLDAVGFVQKLLEENLFRSRAGNSLLSHQEAKLLQQINRGVAPETWQEYHDLVAKRRAETLTPEEQSRLVVLSDQVEIANAERIGYLIELSRLQNKTLPDVMAQLGINSPGYV